MACRFEYKGKTYTQDELAKELEKMLPDEASKYIPEVQSLPNMPMKKTWDELTIKRMIKEAADNGYDAISWTPGEAQAARYDLSKQISKITYNAPGSKAANKYGTVLKAYDHNGHEVMNKAAKPEELSDLIGKEAAEKLLKTETKNDKHELAGLDLKVGGEGMKAFYDKMMVDKVNQLAKKFGGKVETKNLNQRNSNLTSQEIIKDLGYTINEWKNLTNEERTNALINSKHAQPIHVLKLTPELKKVATEKGFPLFTGGLQFPKPLEQPTFDERWRDRVPEEFMQNDEIKNFLDNDKIREYPTNIQSPGRFNDKRQIRLTKVDYDPFK